MAYPSSFITGIARSGQAFDENAWELYNLNEDYTERIDLAKKYLRNWPPLRLSSKSSQSSQSLSYITWDDVLNGRIHRTKGSSHCSMSSRM